MRSLAPAIAVLLIAQLVCEETWAYTRSRDPDYDVCLWWKVRIVTYFVNETCSVDVQLNNCLNAVQAAFDAWNGHACSDMQLLYGGTTPRRDVGYDQSSSDNINLVVWIESGWDEDPRAIALTTTTYDTYTGEIVDADIEVNGTGFTFSTTDSSNVHDIHNTLAHEAGHVIGLDHSRSRDATMWEDAGEGEISKRDLTQDDIDGLCFVYPAGEPTPNYYLSGGQEILCRMDPPNDNCGCVGDARSIGCLTLLFAGVGLLYLIRTRRRLES